MSATRQMPMLTSPAAQWLKIDQALALTGWTDRWLRAKVKAGSVTTRITGRTTANGRPEREYLASSLLGQPQTVPEIHLALVPPTQTAIGPLFAGLQVNSPQILLPTPEAQKQAEKRKAIIQPLLDFAKDPDLFTAVHLQNGRKITGKMQLLAWIREQRGVSVCTLRRWESQYLKGGLPALADHVRSDKGKRRWFASHPKAAMLAAYLYLDQRKSVSFVVEQIRYDAAMLDVAAEDLPSYETVRQFLSQQISPAMQTLAREGRRAYRERMAPYVSRGYSEYANQIWVGDHMIHDVEVANDLFDEQPYGTPIRLRLSAMIDYRSRKVVGASWAWEGSSRAIAATMRRAILQFGPPEQIYVDNGKDYIKVAKGAVQGSELYKLHFGSGIEPKDWWATEYEAIEHTGILARLGIGVTHCIPRHPQSKHVERFFRTLHMRFDAVHSTYTSGSPWTRPEATEEAMMLHRRLLRAGRVTESNHPLASRFILGCLSWLEEYNETPHSGKGMDGRTPNEVFASEQNPNQRPVPSPEILAMLMAEYERRKVHECAVVLNKRRYTPRPEDRLAWAVMHEANEREILIAYDPGDLACAAALDLDGRFMAWLEVEEYLRFAPGDAETQRKIGESMEIRRGLEKATRQSIATISAQARANGAKSAEEALYSRLRIPAAAGEVITQRKPRLKPSKTAVAPQSASDIASSFLEGLKHDE